MDFKYITGEVLYISTFIEVKPGQLKLIDLMINTPQGRDTFTNLTLDADLRDLFQPGRRIALALITYPPVEEVHFNRGRADVLAAAPAGQSCERQRFSQAQAGLRLRRLGLFAGAGLGALLTLAAGLLTPWLIPVPVIAAGLCIRHALPCRARLQALDAL